MFRATKILFMTKKDVEPGVRKGMKTLANGQPLQWN
jgi:hypothetical protein